MLRSALLFVLLSSAAFAQGRGRMFQVVPGETVSVKYPDWVLTPEGKAKLDAVIEQGVQETEKLQAENASMRADLVTWQAKPTLTLPGVILLVGGGFVLGAVLVLVVRK